MRLVWLQATVNIDYYIQFDQGFYSVFYQLARQSAEVRATPTTSTLGSTIIVAN